MKKTILVLAGVASMLASVPAAQAAVVAGNFNVTVSLTSVCTIGSIGDLAFGAYTAFQAGAQTAAPVIATFSCTRGLLDTGVTAAFDTNGTIGSTGATTAAIAMGAGVIAGLQYDITATRGTVGSGTAATAISVGTADSRPFTIAGSMPAGQAGTCTTTLCTAASQIRTLTITY
jgi:spore coat protein U-like protein